MAFFEFMGMLLPMILYMLGITLLVVLIVIGIKFIKTMNKVEGIVEDVDQKVKSLNGVFHIIDTTTDKISSLTDKIVEFVTSFVINMFKKKYNNRKENEENGEEE